jgi:hypothetical protein
MTSINKAQFLQANGAIELLDMLLLEKCGAGNVAIAIRSTVTVRRFPVPPGSLS